MPGSGKTDEVISRLATRYEADPFSKTIALIPALRRGDQFLPSPHWPMRRRLGTPREDYYAVQSGVSFRDAGPSCTLTVRSLSNTLTLGNNRWR